MKITKITVGEVAASQSWPPQHTDHEADRTIRLARCVAGPAAGPLHGTQDDVLTWARAELASAGEIETVPGAAPVSWWARA